MTTLHPPIIKPGKGGIRPRVRLETLAVHEYVLVSTSRFKTAYYYRRKECQRDPSKAFTITQPQPGIYRITRVA